MTPMNVFEIGLRLTSSSDARSYKESSLRKRMAPLWRKLAIQKRTSANTRWTGLEHMRLVYSGRTPDAKTTSSNRRVERFLLQSAPCIGPHPATNEGKTS